MTNGGESEAELSVEGPYGVLIGSLWGYGVAMGSLWGPYGVLWGLYGVPMGSYGVSMGSYGVSIGSLRGAARGCAALRYGPIA